MKKIFNVNPHILPPKAFEEYFDLLIMTIMTVILVFANKILS